MRAATLADALDLIELWQAAGLEIDSGAVPAELSGALDLHPELVVVDVDGAGRLAGAVLGTFDGRRGWVNRLAVRPDLQGKGIGGALLAELTERLIVAGCLQINLLLEPGNARVTGFYERHGFRAHDVGFMAKPLVRERSWNDLKPQLSGEPYVFASVAGAAMPAVPMFAAILEDEGLCLVLTRADADRAGLSYSYVAARITLRGNSSLDEIGLTATVSRVLADAGISCNVIAGAAHDHLFVDWHRGSHAVELLQRL